MALRNIVTVGDPVLTKVCRPVTKFDARLAQLIDDMIETLHDANGAGLAAPQIGVLRRVVIINTEGEDHIYDQCRYVCMANPIAPPEPVEEKKKAWDPLEEDAHRLGRYDFYMRG